MNEFTKKKIQENCSKKILPNSLPLPGRKKFWTDSDRKRLKKKETVKILIDKNFPSRFVQIAAGA